MRRYRFAPTPSRPLHLGSAFAALLAFARAHSEGARFILRIEDIDRTRCKPEHERLLYEDLAWLGLSWDEGPDVGGPYGPYRQSERFERYAEALNILAKQGLIYPCECSRADLKRAQSAPHLHEGGELPYLGTCRPTSPHPRPLLPLSRGGYRLDLRGLNPGERLFVDGIAGPQQELLQTTCGDVLLGRPEAPTYQLAVVYDDIAMGITDVFRGRDLLNSTGRQLALYEAFGAAPPRFSHHPLLVDEDGKKLSKRDEALPLEVLRTRGLKASALVAAFARLLGLSTASALSSLDFSALLAAHPEVLSQGDLAASALGPLLELP